MPANENLFGYAKPSTRLEMNGAFLLLETQLNRMSESLVMHSQRPADSFRADRALALIIAARRLLEGGTQLDQSVRARLAMAHLDNSF